MSSPGDVTLLLQDLRKGDPDAPSKLIPLVYQELRRVARGYMNRERPDHTLQPSALVNEAYLRLAGYRELDWQSRAHFIAVAARVMRQVLLDHARRKQTAKRGSDPVTVPVEDKADLLSPQQSEELIDLDSALSRLEQLDARQCQVVELRFFGGLTVEETAEALNISTKTVKRDWAVARAWLHAEISKEPLNDS